MEPQEKSAGNPGQRNNVERLLLSVHGRCTDNSYPAIDVQAAEICVVQVRGRPKIDMSEWFHRCCIVRVEGINAVVHRCNNHQIVQTAGNPYPDDDQRLSVKLVVDHALEDHSKLLLIDIVQSQHSFM